uniref:Uncharacterized protein n=1 Tax=Surirella sp. TaxID=1526603 RepID=A0A2R4A3H3_9STRA|nr:hypothetical protein [Surirella sp.]
MTVKNFEKPYQMKILTTYLKKTNFFLIFNPLTNKTNPLNKKTVRFRLNRLAKVKMMFSVKQAVFDNILKNDVFLIHFKKIIVFLKDLTKLSLLNFSGVNLNTKIYLFNIFTYMNSFCYLQQKLLIFKHFILYFKHFSK